MTFEFLLNAYRNTFSGLATVELDMEDTENAGWSEEEADEEEGKYDPADLLDEQD